VVGGGHRNVAAWARIILGGGIGLSYRSVRVTRLLGGTKISGSSRMSSEPPVCRFPKIDPCRTPHEKQKDVELVKWHRA
jgi:hypothetical protein